MVLSTWLGGTKDYVLAFDFKVEFLIGISTQKALWVIFRLVGTGLAAKSSLSSASSAGRFRVFIRLVASDLVVTFVTTGSSSTSEVSGVSGTTEFSPLSSGDTDVLGVPVVVVAGV
jgi:hypothetical protein